MMLTKWLVVAIVATVAYHVVLKVTPVAANPYVTLAVTYLLVAAGFVGLSLASAGSATMRDSLATLNWTALALAVAIVCLDVGFLMLYRTGFDVSLGPIITQSAASLALLVIGVAWFREQLTLANVGGILLCVVGLWLISRR